MNIYSWKQMRLSMLARSHAKLDEQGCQVAGPLVEFHLQLYVPTYPDNLFKMLGLGSAGPVFPYSGACTSPAPTSRAGWLRRNAVCTKRAQRTWPLAAGSASASRAATPATWGVAMLVPLMVL